MKLDYPSLEACPCVEMSLRGLHVAVVLVGVLELKQAWVGAFSGVHRCCLCGRCRLELGG